MGFLIQSARQKLQGFSIQVKHRWFKLEKTFLAFLIRFTRQDLYGFSLQVNHQIFKLEKNLQCPIVLNHLRDPSTF